jgi:ssDNA-binding Zn-finger/Zn-ribbon topoisomerase 1
MTAQPLQVGEPAGVCPACGHGMIIRRNRATGSLFRACSAYPTCAKTAPLTAYHEQRRRGAPRLPGLEAGR